MSDTTQIESVDGVMPTSVNGHDGYRIFATLCDAVSGVGEGRNIHVFAKKENRWKPGDEVEILEVNEGFNLNGPGEEDLPDGEGTYVYAKLAKPQGQQGGGKFQRQSKGFGGNKGFQAPKAQAQGFRKPAATNDRTEQETRAAKPAPAPAAAPVKKFSLEEADVVYDRLFGESLRACAHTIADYYGDTDPIFKAQATAQAAVRRANVMFRTWAEGRLDVTVKRNPIQELVKGVDADLSGTDEDDMD